jgi:hypothetical protein
VYSTLFYSITGYLILYYLNTRLPAMLHSAEFFVLRSDIPTQQFSEGFHAYSMTFLLFSFGGQCIFNLGSVSQSKLGNGPHDAKQIRFCRNIARKTNGVGI